MTIERAFNFKHCGTGNVAVRTRQSQPSTNVVLPLPSKLFNP